jgi:hypothetical protein
MRWSEGNPHCWTMQVQVWASIGRKSHQGVTLSRVLCSPQAGPWCRSLDLSSCLSSSCIRYTICMEFTDFEATSTRWASLVTDTLWAQQYTPAVVISYWGITVKHGTGHKAWGAYGMYNVLAHRPCHMHVIVYALWGPQHPTCAPPPGNCPPLAPRGAPEACGSSQSKPVPKWRHIGLQSVRVNTHHHRTSDLQLWHGPFCAECMQHQAQTIPQSLHATLGKDLWDWLSLVRWPRHKCPPIAQQQSWQSQLMSTCSMHAPTRRRVCGSHVCLVCRSGSAH